MKTLVSLLLCALISFGVSGQNAPTSRALSYQECIDEMSTCADSMYVLRNAVLRYDVNRDRRFAQRDSIFRKDLPTIVVSKPVLFENVRFEGSGIIGEDGTPSVLELYKLEFNKKVRITKTQAESELNFANCVFHDEVKIDAVEGSLSIRDSQIDHIFSIRDSEMEDVRIMNCTISGRITVSYLELETIIIANSLFNPDPSLDELSTRLIHYLSIQSNDARIQYNTFKKSTDNQTVWVSTLLNDRYSSFDVNTLDCPVMFHDCVFTGRFALATNRFDSLVGFHNLQFNMSNAYFSWPDLEGKIAGFVWYTYEDVVDGIFFQGFGDQQLVQRPLINRLMIMKQSLYNLYRQQGLISYANGIFIEIKDLETRIFEYDYRQEPRLKGYFDWKMNLFLKRFSAYGTDPVIAIIYAFKVILLFALIYFFFHNDWDIISKGRVQKRLKLFMDYFRRKEGMATLLLEREKEELSELEAFRRDYKNLEKPVPKFFLLAADLHYRFSKLNIDLQTAYYSKTDILKDEWGQISKGRRQWTSFVTGLWFVLYLMIGILVKALNAILLSINAFTTLGFGSIPTQGLPRYIVILQGLIGWVLMTLFSVTLITQLLR